MPVKRTLTLEYIEDEGHKMKFFLDGTEAPDMSWVMLEPHKENKVLTIEIPLEILKRVSVEIKHLQGNEV